MAESHAERETEKRVQQLPTGASTQTRPPEAAVPSDKSATRPVAVGTDWQGRSSEANGSLL